MELLMTPGACAPTPQEVRPLHALHAWNVLDTAPADAFDRITRMVARLFDLPMAAVPPTDNHCQRPPARAGTPRCAQRSAQPQPVHRGCRRLLPGPPTRLLSPGSHATTVSTWCSSPVSTDRVWPITGPTPEQVFFDVFIRAAVSGPSANNF